MLDWHGMTDSDSLAQIKPYRNLVLIRIPYSLKAESGKLKLWWRANFLDFFSMLQNNWPLDYDDIFMSSAIIIGLLKTILFAVSNSFLLSWLVQFIKDLRTFMILRPAKKQFKRIYARNCVGKKSSSKQFLNALNMDTIIFMIGVTEGR